MGCLLHFQLFWMAMGMAFVGQFAESEFKRWLHYQVYTVSFQILGGVLSAVITYHNPENKPLKSGICVANHTSPIDVLVLACDNAYALVYYDFKLKVVILRRGGRPSALRQNYGP